MAEGICVFAEHWNQELSPVFFELITAASEIKSMTKEPLQVILAAKDVKNFVEQMKGLPIDKVYGAELSEDLFFQEEKLSEIYAKMLEQIKPSMLLVPASDQGRSIFPRVAYKLGAGMTADCTELKVDQRSDGSYYLKQMKPSFEENVKVCIECKEGVYPQIATVREGVYEASEKKEEGSFSVEYCEVSFGDEKSVELLEVLPASKEAGSLQEAEMVVVGGRGALEGENFKLLTQFAEKIGAAVGGTRPLMDMGKIPFDAQIGQTGCTIRPKICLSFGVSGAIQHTEGIKNTSLFVAVNTAEDAPIFQAADYGVVMDMKTVLEELIALLD